MSQKPFMWNDNNPVQWSDPSGFCGDPGGTGTRACIDFYVPSPTALSLRGDNRGTTGTATSDRFRVRVDLNFTRHTDSIKVAESRNLNGTSAGMGHNNGSSVTWYGDTAHVHVDASCGNCTAVGDALDFRIRGDFDVTETPNGATIQGTRSAFPSMEMYTYGQNGVRQDANEGNIGTPLLLPLTIGADNKPQAPP
jgi:hypothetical protein